MFATTAPPEIIPFAVNFRAVFLTSALILGVFIATRLGAKSAKFQASRVPVIDALLK
jgi:hypothetical protein